MAQRVCFYSILVGSMTVALMDCYRQRCYHALVLKDVSLLSRMPNGDEELEAMFKLPRLMLSPTLEGFLVRFVVANPSPVNTGSLWKFKTWSDWFGHHVHYAGVSKFLIICMCYVAILHFMFGTFGSLKHNNFHADSNEFFVGLAQISLMLFLFDGLLRTAVSATFMYVNGGSSLTPELNVVKIFWLIVIVLMWCLGFVFSVLHFSGWYLLLIPVGCMLPVLMFHGWCCSWVD